MTPQWVTDVGNLFELVVYFLTRVASMFMSFPFIIFVGFAFVAFGFKIYRKVKRA